jgi:hypothetical protein
MQTMEQSCGQEISLSGSLNLSQMIINGIDLGGLAHEVEQIILPPVVPGRVCHADADFAAYQCSAEGKDGTKTWDDMKHNANTLVETIKGLSGAERIVLHLTPASSDKGGRRDIALLKEYQGNRKDKEKPKYLHIMREYLAQNFPSIQHQNCEADDGMSSMQYEALKSGKREQSIICSKDKDLLMVPGLHVDWDTGVITDSETDYGSIYLRVRERVDSKGKKIVTKDIKGFGQAFFWAQMLTGDTADNISGLPKVVDRSANKLVACGPVKAHELLEKITSNADAFKLVRALYKAYGDEVGFKHWETAADVPWQHAFITEAQLLWMRMNRLNPKCVLDFWRSTVH